MSLFSATVESSFEESDANNLQQILEVMERLIETNTNIGSPIENGPQMNIGSFNNEIFQRVRIFSVFFRCLWTDIDIISPVFKESQGYAS